jgi:type IV secretion system protein VirB10
VNHNIPPNYSEQDDGGQASQVSVANSYGSNPYASQQREAQQMDLDAGAPVLRSADAQRVNKKALMFLAGIIGLVILMAFLVLKGTSSKDEDQKASAQREERVEIPALPAGQTAHVEQASAPADSESPSPPPIPVVPEPAPKSSLPQDDDDVRAQATTLLDRRVMSAEEGNTTKQVAGSTASDAYMQAMLASISGAPQGKQGAPQEQAATAQFLSNEDTLLLRGTYIRCALETRIITDVDGFASCVVTEPVYSVNGRRLLLQKGAKVLGQYGTGAIRGDRAAVIWDRIVTPTGIDVTMASPGVDNLGSAGHPGDYDAHWGSRIASALFISLLSDAFKYAGEKSGPTSTTTYGTGVVVEQPFQSNTARTVQRLADQAVEGSANRPPTVTINQGTIVNIYVSRDVDFSGVLHN